MKLYRNFCSQDFKFIKGLGIDQGIKKPGSSGLSNKYNDIKSLSKSVHYPVHYELVSNLIKSHYESQKLHDYEDVYMLDCTVGTGGHAINLLKEYPNLHIKGLDLDPDLIEKLEQKSEEYESRLDQQNTNFADFDSISEFKQTNRKKYDIVLADLGWNIEQLHDKGISYMNEDEILDMRYDKNDSNTITAKQLLENITVMELKNILSRYGEIDKANLLANEFEKYRSENEISTTGDLKKFILTRDSLGSNKTRFKILSQFFQALRITINNEFGNLEKVIENFPQMVTIKTLFIIIGFHSQENFLIMKNVQNLRKGHKQKFKWIKKGVKPSDQEIEANNASRSAQLHAFFISRS